MTTTTKSNNKVLIVADGVMQAVFAFMIPFATWIFAGGLLEAGIKASVANPDPMMMLVMFAFACVFWMAYRDDNQVNPIPAVARFIGALFSGFATLLFFMSHILMIVENPSQDLTWVVTFWSGWVVVMWLLYALVWYLAKGVMDSGNAITEMVQNLFPTSERETIRNVLDELDYHHFRWGLKAGCNPRLLEDGAFHIRNSPYARFPDDIGGLVDALRAKFVGRNVGVSKSDAGITIRVWADDER
jgi:hypothetical protein